MSLDKSEKKKIQQIFNKIFYIFIVIYRSINPKAKVSKVSITKIDNSNPVPKKAKTNTNKKDL